MLSSNYLQPCGMETSHPLENVISSGKNIDNQSSDILQHSQNRPTGDRCIRLKNMTIQILRKKSNKSML